MAIFVICRAADSKNEKVTSNDFPRLSPGFQPTFNARWISKSQREREGGSVSGAFGHQAPGAGHQTLDAWILSAQRPLTRCSLTPEPPRRLDYSRQSVSSCTQTLVNLVFTGLYRDTPRSPCTSVIASSSDMLKTRLRGGADVKTPGNRRNRADEVDFPSHLPFSLTHGNLMFDVDNRKTWR